MDNYELIAFDKMKKWEDTMKSKPRKINEFSKKAQDKVNSILPEKYHSIMTEVIKNMVKVVIMGAEYTINPPLLYIPLSERERLINERVEFYRKTAGITGVTTGIGGFISTMADFPILIALKVKLLYEIASIYGYDAKDYKERLYILYIFELAFCSENRRLEVFIILKNWDIYVDSLPERKEDFDWRKFQQEYRDYIDLAKLLQIVPVVGGVVGGIANYRLVDKLGDTAINCYRLRYF